MTGLDHLDSELEHEPAEQAHRELREAQHTLSVLAGSVETRADAVIGIIKDLDEIEQRLPGSRAVQEVRHQAWTEATPLRDQLWQDGQRLMAGKAVGLTLGQRRRRMHESVRLLEKARELDKEELPALSEDLDRARHRLAYLRSAQRTARKERGRRWPIYALLVAVVIGGLVFFLCYGLEIVSLPALVTRATATAIATAMPSPSHTDTPASGQTAGPTLVPTVALAPSLTAAAMPLVTPSLAQTATPASSNTATAPPPSPTLAPSDSPVPSPSVTVTASPTREPTASYTPLPSATAPPLPTETPTAVPELATLTPAPTLVPTITPTLGIAYPAPELLQPEDIVFLSQGSNNLYTMRWAWDGTLQADEWFDVRVWREGMPHYGIAWTKRPEYAYDLCIKGNGHFHWSVAVIRGQDGQWLADLSPEAPPRRFSSARNDQWCDIRGRNIR